MANKAAFVAKVVRELSADNGLVWSTEGAIDFWKKVGAAVGNEFGSPRRLVVVADNQLVMGAVVYKFEGGLVLNREGRVFRGAMLASGEYVAGKPVIHELHKLNPVSAFQFVAIRELLSLLSGYSKQVDGGQGMVKDAVGPELEKSIGESECNTMTSDCYQYMDGGSAHVLVNQYVPVFDGREGEISIGKANAAEQIAMVEPVKQQFDAAHAFHKGVFISGSIAHINGAELDGVARTEIQQYMAFLGVGVNIDDESAILISSKEAKGLKRALLALAQVARVENAKPSGWLLNGQKNQIEGHVAQAGFFPTLEFVPGQALWVGDVDRLPTAIVDHVRRGFEVDGITKADENSVTAFLHEPVVIERDGSWHVARFDEGAYTKAGDIVGQAGSALLEHQGKAGYLKWVRWQVVTTLASKKRLLVEWNVVTKERIYKGRSIAKAQPAIVDSSVIYNSLNVELPAMDVVHTMDGIKSDLVYSWLMPIATTALHNNDVELLEMIAGINEEVEGVRHNDYLRIDPVYVLRGRYEKLQARFEEKYGRAVWFDYQDAGDMGWMMNEMYIRAYPTGWQIEECPSDVMEFIIGKYKTDDIVCVADNDGLDEDKTNLIVFVYQGDEVVAYLRRAYGFVGCCNLEGFEDTTVMSSISSSNQLPTYIRSLGRLSSDPKVWEQEMEDMMAEGKGHRLAVKALHVMNRGSTPAGEKVLNLKSVEDVAKLRFMLAAQGVDYTIRSARKGVFGDMSRLLRRHWLQLTDECVLWLPALYSISRVNNDSDASQSVSGLVRQLLLALLEGEIDLSTEAGVTEYDKMGRRVAGMMKSLLLNGSNNKFMGGRRMIAGKRIALPSIPCGEVWVLESSDPNSMYAKVMKVKRLRRAIKAGKECLVASNRAPMADGVVGKLRIVTAKENQAMFWKLNPYQLFVSPASIYVDGGDCDGDGHYITPIYSKVPTFSCEDVRRIRSSLLGIDMFDRDCTGYARDHYGIKAWAKVQLRPSKKSFQTQEKYIKLMEGAASVQMQMVGATYTVCSMAEASSDVLRGLVVAGKEIPARLSWAIAAGNETVGRGYEFYEVPLGGYSPEVEDMWVNFVKPLSDTQKLNQVNAANIHQFVSALVAMGSNSREDAVSTFKNQAVYMAGALNTSAAFCYLVRKLHKVLAGEWSMSGVLSEVREQYGDSVDAKLILFVAAVSHCAFENARGNGIGFRWVDGCDSISKSEVVDHVVEYYLKHKDEEWFKLWIESSTVLKHFFRYVLRDVASAAVSEFTGKSVWFSPADIEFFIGELVEEEEEVEVELEVGGVSATTGVGLGAEESVEIESVAAGVEDLISEPIDGVVDETLASGPANDLVEVIGTISSGKGVDENSKLVVMMASTLAGEEGIVPCNSNLPIGMTNGYAKDVLAGGPNYAQFGFAKDGAMGSFYESPMGFTAAKWRMNTPQGWQFRPVARPFNFELPKVGANGNVSVVLNTRIADSTKSDLNRKHTADVQGELQAEWGVIRDSILNGATTSVAGFDIEMNRGVYSVLEDGVRHYFAVVAVVEEVELLTRGGVQAQCKVSDMVILHIKDNYMAFSNGTGINEQVSAAKLVEFAQVLNKKATVLA